jgi:dipeptidyl aminopeptidase/acylaminoacyl peptidase
MPGVDAAIAAGFADPDRLAVMGHSYGSYSTLALITRTPRFKAAIISGVMNPDLTAGYFDMRNSTGRSSEHWFETGQGLMGATPWENPSVYRDNSPLFGFEHIETPVLIGQGEVDSVAPMTGANSVFVALRRLGKSVEYRVYEGESHGFERPAHVIDFWERRLEFLAEHLDIALDGQGRVVLENGRAKSLDRTMLNSSRGDVSRGAAR